MLNDSGLEVTLRLEMISGKEAVGGRENSVSTLG